MDYQLVSAVPADNDQVLIVVTVTDGDQSATDRRLIAAASDLKAAATKLASDIAATLNAPTPAPATPIDVSAIVITQADVDALEG